MCDFGACSPNTSVRRRREKEEARIFSFLLFFFFFFFLKHLEDGSFLKGERGKGGGEKKKKRKRRKRCFVAVAGPATASRPRGKRLGPRLSTAGREVAGPARPRMGKARRRCQFPFSCLPRSTLCCSAPRAAGHSSGPRVSARAHSRAHAATPGGGRSEGQGPTGPVRICVSQTYFFSFLYQTWGRLSKFNRCPGSLLL